MSSGKRIEEGGRWLLLVNYLFFWSGATAIVVATGYYLWGGWENDSVHGYCVACNASYTTSDSGWCT